MIFKSRFIEMFGDLKENQNYRTILFSQCTKSMIKGPFGSDMKKSLYVPKGKDTYKVYIQLNAIQRNQSLGNYYISKDYFDKKISRFEVKPNDFIITCDGTLGKLLQLDENMEKGVISSSLLKITLDETVIDSSFFEILWTNVILPNLSRYTRNACLVHLPSVSTIGNLEFHLPDLYLQKEYTKLVKQIDKSKFLLQKILEKLELLKKSRFIEMFGDVINNKKTWPTKRWSDVLNIVNGKNQKKVECENGIYPICGSGGKIGKTNEYLTKENSVIIGRKGNINNPILMKTKFWNVDTAFGLEPNNKDINVEYLYKFCKLFDFQRLNKTVTIPSLTKSDLLKIEIPVPPMKLQEEYRNFLAQVDKSKLVIQKSLEDLVGKS